MDIFDKYGIFRITVVYAHTIHQIPIVEFKHL